MQGRVVLRRKLNCAPPQFHIFSFARVETKSNKRIFCCCCHIIHVYKFFPTISQPQLPPTLSSAVSFHFYKTYSIHYPVILQISPNCHQTTLSCQEQWTIYCHTKHKPVINNNKISVFMREEETYYGTQFGASQAVFFPRYIVCNLCRHFAQMLPKESFKILQFSR